MTSLRAVVSCTGTTANPPLMRASMSMARGSASATLPILCRSAPSFPQQSLEWHLMKRGWYVSPPTVGSTERAATASRGASSAVKPAAISGPSSRMPLFFFLALRVYSVWLQSGSAQNVTCSLPAKMSTMTGRPSAGSYTRCESTSVRSSLPLVLATLWNARLPKSQP